MHKLDRPRPLGGYAPKTSSATPRVNHIRGGYTNVHPPMVCGPISLVPSTGLGMRLMVYMYIYMSPRSELCAKFINKHSNQRCQWGRSINQVMIFTRQFFNRPSPSDIIDCCVFYRSRRLWLPTLPHPCHCLYCDSFISVSSQSWQLCSGHSNNCLVLFNCIPCEYWVV